MDLQELYNRLKAIDKSVIVLGHARPDMDCIGSAIGLAELLQSWGKEAYAMMPEPIPSYAKQIVEGTPLLEPSRDFLMGRTIIAVDVAEKGLLGSFSEFPVEIAIDHHLSHIEFATHTYVKKVPSVSEIISELWQLEAGAKNPTVAAASSMYAGYLFDTGRWWWGGVTPQSFRNAAYLVECGADPQRLNDILYADVAWGHLRLLGKTLERLEIAEDGKIVVGVLTEADFVAAEASRYDKEGIVDVLRNIRGVQIAALLREEKGICKVAVRARDNSCRVDKLCERFGGGGHAAAAGVGAGIKGSLDDFKAEFVKAAVEHWAQVQAGEFSEDQKEA